MNKKIFLIGKIINIFVCLIVLAFCIIYGIWGTFHYLYTPHQLPDYTFPSDTKNAIHFLNTGQSDCIIIESEDGVAIIDSGYGQDYIKADTEYAAAPIVSNYLNKLNKQVKFALATHAHRDHVSGFVDLVRDYNIDLGKLYIKEALYHGNKKALKELKTLCGEKDIEIDYNVENLKLNLGNYKLTVFNGEPQQKSEYDDNVNSMGILVEYNEYKIFLAGDICNYDDDEDRLASIIGEVDLLKVGHHGFKGSSSENFIRTLSPNINITTNYRYPNEEIFQRLKRTTLKNTYLTGKYNGIVVVLDNHLKLFGNTCVE